MSGGGGGSTAAKADPCVIWERPRSCFAAWDAFAARHGPAALRTVVASQDAAGYEPPATLALFGSADDGDSGDGSHGDAEPMTGVSPANAVAASSLATLPPPPISRSTFDRNARRPSLVSTVGTIGGTLGHLSARSDLSGMTDASLADDDTDLTQSFCRAWSGLSAMPAEPPPDFGKRRRGRRQRQPGNDPEALEAVDPPSVACAANQDLYARLGAGLAAANGSSLWVAKYEAARRRVAAATHALEGRSAVIGAVGGQIYAALVAAAHATGQAAE